SKDGRVLVTDFGLVGVHTAYDDEGPRPPALPRAGLTEKGAVLGTPGYIAPELQEGKTPDARVDQFAFCVALENALDAQERPAPAWLKAIGARGKHDDRDERFPDMRALLEVLADDPSARRRRWTLRVGFVAAGLVTLASVALAVSRQARDARE